MPTGWTLHLLALLATNVLIATQGKTLLQRRHALGYAPYCKFDADIIADDALLANAIRQADYVFSGKVSSDTQRATPPSNATLRFDIAIKRHFKHPANLEDVSVVRAAKTLHDGEGVKCRQVVRYRYTAIFVARRPIRDDKSVDVELIISPVPITLGNLDRVNAATEDVAYKPVHTFVEETCEKTFCAWGAQCITRKDGRALCQCPTQCRTHSDPVCGTDRRTYVNECQLRVASCRAKINTRVMHQGACEQSDPCKDKRCGFGARCVAAPDGRNASCQCAPTCPNYGDHLESRPVCGSDGADYKDECGLRLAACTSLANITVKFAGKCDPCSGVQCAEPEICQLDDHRNPVCRCGETCPLEFTPVCGSDGKTYSNECTLKQEACRARRSLSIIYRGKCSSGVNPCMSVRCTLGEECAINKFGIARCECPASCEPIMRPVCAKDGRTYPSECELKRAGCVSRTAIEVAYAGACGEMGPCSDHECHFGATCVERSGKAHCECPTCPAEFEPVCGSDGISYGNECKLRLEGCKHRREIRVLYNGPCNGCENKKCDFYSTCESNGSSEGRCVCPETCKDEKVGAVCGTDGVTYTSECDLRISACQAKQYVLVAYKGDCDLCKAIECKFGGRCEAGECVCPTNCEGLGDEPVCASNMQTYANECELQKAACLLQATGHPSLNVIFYGDCRERFPLAGAALTTPSALNAASASESNTIAPDSGVTGPAGPMFTHAEREACRDIRCDFEATCELGADNFPRCSCRFDCAGAALVSTAKPVCASDLRIYPSICAMKMEACQRQEELRLRPLDLCQGMEVKPCNGERPIADPLSGKELDCGHGLQRQDCPSGSYCHQTTRFARCCNKDQSVLVQKSCDDSWYGCCPDGRTPAAGPEHAGCPSTCGCNKLGSYSDTCDPDSQQCKCRPGVGGEKCDRCEPGYWGLPKISSGHHGCIPCGCSTFGSVRDDCEQMTGRCVCKPGIQGQKCTMCTSHDRILGPNGCVPVDLNTPSPTTCKELTCHFGGTCIERSGLAICECHSECKITEEEELAEMKEEDAASRQDIVCGSDGQTYASACKLRQVACKLQKDIVVQAFGTCKEDMFPGTDWPMRRYTPLQFTQADDANSPLSKSTRHLLAPDPRYYYERRGSALQPAPPGGPYTIDQAYIALTHEHNLSATGPDNIYNTRGATYAAAFRPTPATVRVVTALLGDLCSDTSDCLIMYSSCVLGACSCLPEYSESPDRQECIATPNPTDEYHACSSSPCLHESHCVDLPSATFTCVCGSNFTGVHCETELVHKMYEVPSFDGHSYVRLKPLNAYHKLSIEMEFKTYTNDGILLYNQQKDDGLGDFISLAIVGGYIEFRYNLGDGAVVITSLETVELNKFHRVVAKRYHRDGMLQLDDGENVAGQAGGTLRALDLLEDTFVGFVPSNYSRVYENIGVDRGLQGCIRRLKIGRRSVELQEHRDDWVVGGQGVHECGERNPCASIPCQNGGRCQSIDAEVFRCVCGVHFAGDVCEHIIDPCLANPCTDGATCDPTPSGGFLCKCPLGRKGDVCEIVDTDRDITVPEFNGTSFLQFPRLEGISKSFAIEVAFLTRVSQGLILYNGQMRNGRGDFISLGLVHGHVHFRFNLGSGIANITSKEPVSLGEWHWARIYRNGREGMLQLDNNTMVHGVSGAPLTELNLELPFYVGAVMSWQEVHRLAGVSRGFKGAVQRILLNGVALPISGRIPHCSFAPVNTSCGFEIGVYDGLPCPSASNPCRNNAVCVPDLNHYRCQCDASFEGHNCEHSKDDSAAVKFTGITFLQYKNRGYKRNLTATNSNEEYESASNNDLDMSEDETAAENGDAEIGDAPVNANSDLDYDVDAEDDDTNFYDVIGRKGEGGNRYEFKVRTFVPDGLLLWRSKNNRSLKDDYFAIAIANGYPELSYNLGQQKSFWAIRTKTRVDDGKWHLIHVRRRKRVGLISVDGGEAVKGVSDNGDVSLSTNSKLWIGGAPSLPAGLPSAYYNGFEGCIQHVHVHAKPINLMRHSESTLIQFCHDNEI